MKTLTLATCLALAMGAAPARAFDVTDAATIMPILEMTRANWVALRNWEGQELLYFTHLEAWRCALTSVHYSINGGESMEWTLAPCQTGTPSPNSLPGDYLPFTALPLDHLQTISVRIKMNDGAGLDAEFARASILMP